MAKSKVKASILLNATSQGSTPTFSVAEVLSHLAGSYEHPIEVFASHQGVHGIEDAFVGSMKRGTELLIVCGDDPTLSEVVHTIYKRECEEKLVVAFLPTTKASRLSKTLDLPGTVEATVQGIKKKKTSRVDVWCAEVESAKGNSLYRYFLHYASIGFLSYCADHSRKVPTQVKGFWRQLAALGWSMPRWKNQLFEIEIDDEKIKGPFFNLAFCNGPLVGEGVLASSTAKVDDGQINVVLTGDVNKRDALYYLLQAAGQETPIDELDSQEVVASEVEVNSFEPIPVDCDGDVVGFTPAKISKCMLPLSMIRSV